MMVVVVVVVVVGVIGTQAHAWVRECVYVFVYVCV